MNDKDMIIEKVKAFYDKEVSDIEKLIQNPPFWFKPRESAQIAVHRCLGVCFFAQSLGAPYDKLEVLYNEVKEKLDRMALL